MLTLLNTIKSLITPVAILLALISFGYGYTQHKAYMRLYADYAKQSQQIDTQNKAIQHWQAEAARVEKAYKLKAKEVAKHDAASKKRLDAILKKQFSKNCTEAIKEGIASIQK